MVCHFLQPVVCSQIVLLCKSDCFSKIIPCILKNGNLSGETQITLQSNPVNTDTEGP